jgi:bifunctional UDP-N-acetylglucosamine pyrophosphorylase / glucosamine-1-phosphate N-acetyltransferase
MSLSVVVLAAGQGTRMRSALPKVLHPLAGRPMLAHVVETAEALDPERVVVVYGHGGSLLRERLPALAVDWAEQLEQRGTAHAVQQAVPLLSAEQGLVLVLYGDVPLIRAATLQSLLEQAVQTGFALLTVTLDDPTGYGRILRDAEGRVAAIVEHKDASTAERAVREVNTGVLAIEVKLLRRLLPLIGNSNAQGEYYLTDLVALAVSEGGGVEAVGCADAMEVSGVNNRLELARVERAFQRRQAESLLLAGTSLADPDRFDLRGELQAGLDVSIDVDVVIEGRVVLGDGVRVGPFCVLRDCEIGAGTEVLAYSHLEGLRTGQGCRIGPYARVRPGSTFGDAVHIGNFVELKQSTLGEQSKVNHLSYVGDTLMGSECNIGAGTITCNYDGAGKHQTVIGNKVFVGSDVQLIAPVRVGDGATIAAGTTVAEDAPAGQLTVGRVRQQVVLGWRRPEKTPPEGNGSSGGDTR